MGTCDDAQYTFQFVAKTLGLKLNSVLSICHRYKSRGCTLVENSYAKQKKTFFTRQQLKTLLSEKTLNEHVPFNLVQRCEWIWKKWKVKIHKNALMYIYKENGIRFLAAKYHFHDSNTPE